MSVLVTHAHNRLAYYATRCLSRQGIKVTCASEFPLAACFFSRYCTDHFTYPSPWKHPDLFVKKVINEIEKRDIEVLMPVHREGYILSKYKDVLDQQARFPYPSYSKIVSVNDKMMMIDIAEKAGFKTPTTIAPNSLQQVKEAKSILHFPVLIKLRRGHGGIGMTLVNNPKDLVDEYRQTLQKFKPSTEEEYPIIQEYIQGHYVSPRMLFNHGRLRAKHSISKIREEVRTEYKDPKATSATQKLGENLNWHGMINTNLIIKENTDQPYLFDLNPRLDGSISHAIISGIKFPYLLYRMAIDGDIEPALDYERNRKTRFFWGDLFNIPKFIQKRKWKEIGKIMTCQATPEFWDPTDPIPFLAIPIYSLVTLLGHGTMQPLIEKY